MLLLFLAEEIAGELPAQIITDNISAAENTETHASEPLPPPPPPPPKAVIAVFGPAYEHTLVKIPYSSHNSTSNATVSRFFTGAAYDVARNLAQLSEDTQIELLGVVGNDTYGHTMLKCLNDSYNVSVQHVEFNDKFSSPNIVQVIDSTKGVEKQRSQDKKDADADGEQGSEEGEAVHAEADQAADKKHYNMTASYANNDVYERINYKYAYAHRFPLISSKLLFFDAAVNENAIRYVMEHGGYKAFSLYRGMDYGLKLSQMIAKLKPKQNTTLGYFTVLDIAATHGFASTTCMFARSKDPFYYQCYDGIDFLKFLVSNYSEVVKKVPYADYLTQYSATLLYHLAFLHTTVHSDNIIVKLPQGAIYSVSGQGVLYAEHSCMSDRCRKSDFGADEAFVAGLMHAVRVYKPLEDAVEFAGMCEIAVLKEESSATEQLNERYIARLEQSNFISKRWLFDSRKEAPQKAEQEAYKE